MPVEDWCTGRPNKCVPDNGFLAQRWIVSLTANHDDHMLCTEHSWVYCKRIRMSWTGQLHQSAIHIRSCVHRQCVPFHMSTAIKFWPVCGVRTPYLPPHSRHQVSMVSLRESLQLGLWVWETYSCGWLQSSRHRTLIKLWSKIYSDFHELNTPREWAATQCRCYVEGCLDRLRCYQWVVITITGILFELMCKTENIQHLYIHIYIYSLHILVYVLWICY